MKLSQLIQACGHDPLQPKGDDNEYGTGHLLHAPRIFTCAGKTDAEGNVTDRHIIGILTKSAPDGQYMGVIEDEHGNEIPTLFGYLPTERADEGTWELDPLQTGMDPANPACQVCGQPPVL